MVVVVVVVVVGLVESVELTQHNHALLFHLLKFSLTYSTTSPKYLMVVPLISTSHEICSLCMAPSENPCFFKSVLFFFFGALVGWALLFLSCCCWARAPTTPCSHHGEIGTGYVSSQIEQLLTSYCRQHHHHHPRVQGYWGLPTEYHTSKPPVVVVVVVVAQTLNPQACT